MNDTYMMHLSCITQPCCIIASSLGTSLKLHDVIYTVRTLSLAYTVGISSILLQKLAAGNTRTLWYPSVIHKSIHMFSWSNFVQRQWQINHVWLSLSLSLSLSLEKGSGRFYNISMTCTMTFWMAWPIRLLYVRWTSRGYSFASQVIWLTDLHFIWSFMSTACHI